MKHDPITKLYTDLTDAERAALSFNYMMQNNVTERRRIESAMPMQNFTNFPLEYRRAFDGIAMVAALYAVEYWRDVSMANMFLADVCAISPRTIQSAGHLADEEILQNAEYLNWRATVDSLEGCEIALASLEAAIDKLCAERGICPVAIRKMAGDRTYKQMQPDIKPNAYIVAEFHEIWGRVLDA